MDNIILEGYISIKEALMDNSRDITLIMMDKANRTKKTSFIKRLANDSSIKIDFVTRIKIDNLASGNTHGGIIAIASEKKFVDLSYIVNNYDKQIYYLTGIEDPYNLGYSLRTLFSSGIINVVIDSRNFSKFSSIVSKTSAGCFEKMNIALCDDYSFFIKSMKDANINIVCAMKSNDAVSLKDYDFNNNKQVIIIGGEKRGINKTIIEAADKAIFIEYGNINFKYSLPTNIAVAIISYHILANK